jgi:hypothetical protein
MSKELSMITILYKISQNKDDLIIQHLWLLYIRNNKQDNKKLILEMIENKIDECNGYFTKDLYSKFKKIMLYNFCWIEGYNKNFIEKLEILCDAFDIKYVRNERIFKRNEDRGQC